MKSLNKFPLALAAISSFALIGACSGNPSGPGDAPTIAAAHVIVGAQSVEGRTIGSGAGASTVLRATVRDPQGAGTVRSVVVEYSRPMGMHSQHHTGVIELHDDGMGCDEVAGDGDYCDEDHGNEFGCHEDDAEHGEYHYEFYCLDDDDHHSDHMMLTVTVE